MSDELDKWYLSGYLGIDSKTPRNPLAIRAKGISDELISFEDASGNTKWHINQNLSGKFPGLNFVETGVADGRLFIGAGGNVGIGTVEPKAKLHVLDGAIMPAAGNDDKAGILFPSDPGGGSGDKAWIRYYARAGGGSSERTALEIGVANDTDPKYQDDILLKPSGGVAIGINEVMANARLSVEGGAIAIGASASVAQKADAALHIFSSYGNLDRLLQMSPNAPSKPGLNLLASRDNKNQEQWWSWGVTIENIWRINPGKEFSLFGGLAIASDGTVKTANLTVLGKLAITNDTVIGDGGNAKLLVRHIDGKRDEKNDRTVADLYLNYENGQPVHIGGGGGKSNLYVNGDLYAHNAVITYPTDKRRAREILENEPDGTAIVGAANGINEARIDFFFKYKGEFYQADIKGYKPPD